MLEQTDADALIVETARRFAQERLAPHCRRAREGRRDRAGDHPRAGRDGLPRRHHQRRVGRQRRSPYETYAQVVEEIAAGDGSVSTLVSVHNAPTCEILEKFGTDGAEGALAAADGERRRRWAASR